MGHLVVGADDEVFEGVAGVERAGGGPAVVVAGGLAGGAGGGAAAGDGAIGGALLVRGGGGSSGGREFDGDEATSEVAQALGDQVQVVVVDPNGGKFIGYAKSDDIFGGFQAHDRFKPHMENILREERLEVGFHGVP